MVKWKTIDQGNQVSTAVAAAASEKIDFQDSRFKREFNYLSVVNLDVVDLELRLNGQTEAGMVEAVPAGSTFTIDPEEGRKFDFVQVVNKGAVVQTAGKIYYRAAQMEEEPTLVTQV